MKTVLILIVASASAYSAAQIPGYANPRYPGSGPTQQGQASSGQRGNSSGANRAAGGGVPTEVIRVLSSASVQKELNLTSQELSGLEQVSRTIPAVTTSEEDAFTAVSKDLTATQVAQLQQLMVQDLGYGALALSSVRSKLALTEEQSSQILTLVDIQEAAKRAILSQSSKAGAAVKSISQLASKTDAALAKALSSTQNSTLRNLSAKLE